MIMKKIIITGIISMFFSCKRDFLELAPKSNANVQNFYKTPEDMRVAVNAAYASLMLLGQYTYAYFQFGEVRSDNTANYDGPGNFPDGEIDLFKEVTSNAIIEGAWMDTYHGILLCNVVLNRIEGVSMNETLKNQFIGEMEFLRSLMYFNLVRVFGDVPLVLRETKSVSEGYQQGRVAVATVYEQIEKDLLDATQKLPISFSGSDVGRATKGAAKGLLGKVYLTRKNYAAAASVLKEVIDQNSYQILTNYVDLWKPANGNSAESLFEVQYKKGGTQTGSNFNNQFAPRNSDIAVTGVGFADGRNTPTASLISAYENGDLRKNISLAESYVNAAGQTVNDAYTLKFKDTPFIQGDADNNWPVLRYADVLLMYAESLNGKNGGADSEAYKAINAVRARAGLGALSNLNAAQFASAIEHERQVELAFEGHRWFDLLRTDHALDVMNANFAGSLVIKPYQLLFPIPQSQININPNVMKQNPGY
jgi:hypothetical protein